MSPQPESRSSFKIFNPLEPGDEVLREGVAITLHLEREAHRRVGRLTARRSTAWGAKRNRAVGSRAAGAQRAGIHSDPGRGRAESLPTGHGRLVRRATALVDPAVELAPDCL